MAKGISANSKEKDNANPNRAEKRQAIKDEKARAKRAIMATKARFDLKNMPVWMKVAGVAIVFSFCGGAFLLEIIFNQSQNESRALLWFVPIIVLLVAGFGWWSWKVQKPSEKGSKVSNSSGATPLEKIHGKWRMKAAGTTPGLLTPTSAVQRKERQPSKKYQAISQTALASPLEVGQTASIRASNPQAQGTLDGSSS